MHKRQAIRQAVISKLTAVSSLTGGVDSNRVRRTLDADLPCAIVNTLKEPAAPFAIDRQVNRDLSLVVEIRAKATADLDDSLDDLCVAVETALAEDPNFGDLVDNSWLEETVVGLNGEADERHGVALLTYHVTYQTDGSGPAV